MLLNDVIKKYINELVKTIYFVKQLIWKKNYPLNSNGKVYVHLGCGKIESKEFINVDNRPFTHIHHIHDVTSLPFFKDDFADLIYASHILEHLPMNKLESVLLEWRRVLKKGGVLRIGVPNFDTILNIYKDSQNSIGHIWQSLMGGQDYPENFHYSIFNKNYMVELFNKVGFVQVKEWDPNKVENHNFSDWTSVKFIINDKEYPISLNLEAIK